MRTSKKEVRKFIINLLCEECGGEMERLDCCNYTTGSGNMVHYCYQCKDIDYRATTFSAEFFPQYVEELMEIK